MGNEMSDQEVKSNSSRNLSSINPSKNKWFIAVHCGAGNYSPSNVSLYKDLMKQACMVAAQSLVQNQRQHQNNDERGTSIDALEATSLSISVLENSELTNAGVGSNLNEKGQVECDACVAVHIKKQVNENRGRSQVMYGSVGAVYGVMNPILLAREIIMDYMNSPGILGRVKPLMLCSKGAYYYARNSVHCQHLAVERDESKLDRCMVTAKSLHTFNDHRSRVDHYMKNQRAIEAKRDLLQYSKEHSDLFYDTVGAISCDSNGNMSAGVSSGGISLKYAGRIGEAAIYGSGIHVSDSFSCSCTGVGEDIMLNQMASKCAMFLENGIEGDVVSSLKRVLRVSGDEDKDNDTIISPTEDDEDEQHDSAASSGLLPHHNNRHVGILACHRLSEKHMELAWAYTTRGMGVAYYSSTMKEPVAFVSFHKNYDPNRSNIQFSSLSI